MSRVTWDKTGEKRFETGVDHGVLYLPNSVGQYDTGFVWNGLVTVTESPSGAEANPQFADNIKYLNLTSKEDFGATIEAYTYPDEFGQCDGTASPSDGLKIGQQNRKPFGFCYRTLIGNDIDGQKAGYKLHLVYGAQAAPSEKAHGTINDSPEAITFSWEVSTTPVEVPGYDPSATIEVDSTTTPSSVMTELEDILYGTEGQDPRLPLPAEVLDLFTGTTTTVAPVAPSYNAATDTITIPAVTGVIYMIDDQDVSGSVVITEDTLVTARAAPGYKFPAVTDNDWLITHT
jgi:hypothetical protein